jgi:glycopeptide antibiotics resistance protein
VRGDDDVLRIPALTNLPWFLPGFAVSVVVGYLVRNRAARFLGASPILGWAVVVSLGIVASATLTPLHEAAVEGGAQAAGCDFSRVGLASLEDIRELGDTFLNILLFIPLGAALALLPRSGRKAWLMAVALVLPFAIETTQLIATPLDRACQSADVVDNISGLILGFAVGSVAGYVLSRTIAASGRRAE